MRERKSFHSDVSLSETYLNKSINLCVDYPYLTADGPRSGFTQTENRASGQSPDDCAGVKG